MKSTPQKHRVLHLTANLPGPLAASKLAELGISVTKIESPEGDPFEKYDPEWYRLLHRNQNVVKLDLKDPAQRQKVEEFLTESQVFMTSVRPGSLKKLGLDPESLKSRFPKLHVVTIQGFPAPNENVPAHDLNCQADAGLLNPPHLPKALVADFAVVERAFAMCLLGLLRAGDDAQGSLEIVTMSGMSEEFAMPLKRNHTTPKGALGGAHPGYNIYRAKDGWIAAGALEPHFLEKLVQTLGLKRASQEEFARVFSTEPVSHWLEIAEKNDLPLSSVK